MVAEALYRFHHYQVSMLPAMPGTFTAGLTCWGRRTWNSRGFVADAVAAIVASSEQHD